MPARAHRKPLSALAWLLVAAGSAFALAHQLGRALQDVSTGSPWAGHVLGVFVLVLAAIGALRSVAGSRGALPRRSRRWLGLPDRDWAFSGTFALVTGSVLWWVS